MGWRDPAASIPQILKQMVQPGCIASAEPVDEQIAAVGKLGQSRPLPSGELSPVPASSRRSHVVRRVGPVKPFVDEQVLPSAGPIETDDE